MGDVSVLLESISGSNSYAVICVDQGDSIYYYLLNYRDGEITDPLALLDEEIRNDVNMVTVSPGGRYIFVGYCKSEKALLLDCSSGRIIDPGFETDLQFAAAYFFDDEQALIVEKYGKRVSYHVYTYSISDGSKTDRMDLFPSEAFGSRYSLNRVDGTVFSHKGKNLMLFDLETMTSCETDFRSEQVTQVFLLRDGRIGVVSDGILFSCSMDGDAVAIAKMTN